MRVIQQPDGSWIEPPGYDALWAYFGLSYASWLTLPRVMMHEMPDEWQGQMAKLLTEFDKAFPNAPSLKTIVMMKRDNRFIKAPDWLQYRHPDIETINSFRATPTGDENAV